MKQVRQQAGDDRRGERGRSVFPGSGAVHLTRDPGRDVIGSLPALISPPGDEGRDIVKRLRFLALAGAFACAAPPAFAQNPFGAVVLGRIFGGEPSWGLAWSTRGYDDAGEDARNECYERGAAACLIVGYSRASCSALAVDAGNGHGAGWGESLDSAEGAALSACRALGRTCRIVVSRCAG